MYEKIETEMLRAQKEIVKLLHYRGQLMDRHDDFKAAHSGDQQFSLLADIKNVKDQVDIYNTIYCHNRDLLASLKHDNRTRI